MQHTIELIISDCTKEPETCPVVERIFSHDAFEEQIQELDPTVQARRDIFANFVVACAKGNCPGQDPRLADQIVRQNREQGT